jgi:hypothetical protein
VVRDAVHSLTLFFWLGARLVGLRCTLAVSGCEARGPETWRVIGGSAVEYAVLRTK